MSNQTDAFAQQNLEVAATKHVDASEHLRVGWGAGWLWIDGCDGGVRDGAGQTDDVAITGRVDSVAQEEDEEIERGIEPQSDAGVAAVAKRNR